MDVVAVYPVPFTRGGELMATGEDVLAAFGGGNGIVTSALGLVGTLVNLIQQAAAAQAAGQAEQAALIEKQLVEATAAWTREHGGLRETFAAKDKETLKEFDEIDAARRSVRGTAAPSSVAASLVTPGDEPPSGDHS